MPPAELPDRSSLPASPRLVLAAIVLVAFNLRSAISSVPPLVDRIGADLSLSSAALGLLTTLPVLCMGVFAPVAQRLGRRIGRERAIAWAVIALLAGLLARLGGEHLVLLYGGTLAAGFGIAVCGTLMSGVIKEFFPERPGRVTGLYMVAMMSGAALGSALTVPLASALGSWPASLGSWSVTALLGLGAWTPVALRSRRPLAADRGPVVAPSSAGPSGAESPRRQGGLPWRHPTAWLIATYLAMQSLQFYSCLAWLPASYELHGWSPGGAGTLVSAFSATQIVSGLAAPVLADRVHDKRALLWLSAALGSAGLLGVLLAPTSVPLLWMVLLGLGQGAAFALGLVLLVDFGGSPSASARLSGLGFFVAYSLASVGPVVLGAIRDATGSFTLPFALLGLAMAGQIAVIGWLSPQRARLL
jgi:CP family cyanate transporter-like MFS transporter